MSLNNDMQTIETKFSDKVNVYVTTISVIIEQRMKTCISSTNIFYYISLNGIRQNFEVFLTSDSYNIFIETQFAKTEKIVHMHINHEKIYGVDG